MPQRFLPLFILCLASSAQAWDGPPAVIGGGLMTLEHPVSYLDAFESGTPAATLPFDSRLRGNFLASESADSTLQLTFKAESVEFPQAFSFTPGNANGGPNINIPTNLWGFDVGALYNKKINETDDWGLITSIGSDSDLPFNSINEIDVGVTATYHHKVDPLHAWLFFINETNNRSFAPWIPIPGAGYFVLYPQQHMQAFYGLPLFFGWQPDADWSFSASYFLLTVVTTELDYRVSKGKLYASFQWMPQTWLRANRADPLARIIYDQKKVLLGWKFDFGSSFFANLGAGFAFDQRIGEAESILSSGTNYTYLPAGFTAQVDVAYRFF